MSRYIYDWNKKEKNKKATQYDIGYLLKFHWKVSSFKISILLKRKIFGAKWSTIWYWNLSQKDWKQKEKGAAEDKMVRQHHWLSGHKFEQTPGDSEGQGSLGCCSPWGHRVRHSLANKPSPQKSAPFPILSNTLFILFIVFLSSRISVWFIFRVSIWLAKYSFCSLILFLTSLNCLSIYSWWAVVHLEAWGLSDSAFHQDCVLGSVLCCLLQHTV